jgi:hypothetical protein
VVHGRDDDSSIIRWHLAERHCRSRASQSETLIEPPGPLACHERRRLHEIVVSKALIFTRP